MVMLKSEKYKGFRIEFRKGRTQTMATIKSFPRPGSNKELLGSNKVSVFSQAKSRINNLK